jgi:hypothetical protein
MVRAAAPNEPAIDVLRMADWCWYGVPIDMTKRHRMQALALCAPLIPLCGSLCSGLGQEHKQNGPIEDGTIVSVAALQRGRVILCRDCNMQEQSRRKSVRPHR